MSTRRRLNASFFNEMLASYSFSELHHLRREAMSRFEGCLADDVTQPFEAFIEQQVAQENPPLMLLDDITADLRQRLLALQQSYYDTRAHALRGLQDSDNIDLGTLLPAEPREPLNNVSALIGDDNPVLTEALTTTITELRVILRHIQLTEHLLAYTSDWLTGLHVMAAQSGHENHKPATH